MGRLRQRHAGQGRARRSGSPGPEMRAKRRPLLSSEGRMGSSASPRRPDIHAVRPIPVRHPGRWIGGALLALFVLAFLKLLVTNENLQWDVVAAYMFSAEILAGM